MEVRFLDKFGKALRAWGGRTNASGRNRLISQLDENDRIGIEACALGFVLAREIIEKVGAKVYVLNSGRMYMIFRSIKKTDSEDALKIARLIAAYPEEALPLVSILTEKEERYRAIVREMQFLTQSRTRYINRLHSICLRQGISTVTKAHLKTEKRRLQIIEMLETYRKHGGLRLHGYIVELERDIKILKQTERDYLTEEENAKYVLSIPGIGPKTAMRAGWLDVKHRIYWAEAWG